MKNVYWKGKRVLKKISFSIMRLILKDCAERKN